MEREKIDEAKVLFWTRLELKVKIGSTETVWTGWQAVLIHEFIVSGAAMTGDGAREIVLTGGKAHVDPETIRHFIDERHKDGLLKISYERSPKTGDRRQIYSSTLQPSQFEYQRTVLEEEK